MKYLDRKKLGIELFLAMRSSAFSRRNELTPDEFIERLSIQPLFMRTKVVEQVRDAIAQLKSSKYDVADCLPQEITEMNTNDINAEKVSRIKPFFSWLISLWRDNDHARSQWMSQLKTVTASLPTNAGDSLYSVATGNTQRVLIRKADENTIEMSLNERSWGRLALVFPNCTVKNDGSFPMLGYIYIMEAESAGEGRYSFEVLLDTEFSESTDSARSLRSSNWQTLTFESDAPTAVLDSMDYVKILRLRGNSMLKTVRTASTVLCDKKAVAGENMLTRAETAIFPVAWLLSNSKRLADMKDEVDSKTKCALFELFENRYRFRQIIRLFEETGEKYAVKELEKIEKGVEEEDDGAVLKAAQAFSAAIDEGARQGVNMPLVKKLYDELAEASAQVEEKGGNRENLICAVSESFKKAIEPELEKNGFVGTYPNYRRTRRGRGEILTVVVEDGCEIVNNSTLTYKLSACAAKVKRTREERQKELVRGIDFASVYATDLEEELPHLSKTGRLDCIFEGGGIPVTVDMCTRECEEVDSEAVRTLVDAVCRAMNEKGLKRAQKKRRKADKKAKTPHPFIRAFVRFLPASTIMCVAALAAYLLLCRYNEAVAAVPVRYACIPIALAGVITAVIASFVRCIVHKNKLWRY